MIEIVLSGLACLVLSPAFLIVLEAVVYRRIFQLHASQEALEFYDAALRPDRPLHPWVIQATLVGLLLLGVAIAVANRP